MAGIMDIINAMGQGVEKYAPMVNPMMGVLKLMTPVAQKVAQGITPDMLTPGIPQLSTQPANTANISTPALGLGKTTPKAITPADSASITPASTSPTIDSVIAGLPTMDENANIASQMPTAPNIGYGGNLGTLADIFTQAKKGDWGQVIGQAANFMQTPLAKDIQAELAVQAHNPYHARAYANQEDTARETEMARLQAYQDQMKGWREAMMQYKANEPLRNLEAENFKLNSSKYNTELINSAISDAKNSGLEGESLASFTAIAKQHPEKIPDLLSAIQNKNPGQNILQKIGFGTPGKATLNYLPSGTNQGAVGVGQGGK